MPEVTLMKDKVIMRISPIVENLMNTETLFQEKLEPYQIIESCGGLMTKHYSTTEFMEISDNELENIIHDIMIFEATAGMLSDLTIEQLQMFDEAVKRK